MDELRRFFENMTPMRLFWCFVVIFIFCLTLPYSVIFLCAYLAIKRHEAKEREEKYLKDHGLVKRPCKKCYYIQIFPKAEKRFICERCGTLNEFKRL